LDNNVDQAAEQTSPLRGWLNRSATMADRPRTTAAQQANEPLVDEHPGVLRERAAWMAAELMPGRGRRAPGPRQPTTILGCATNGDLTA
jgi:hypothetical protein